MARTRVRYAEAPPRNDVYVGMLAATALVLAVGCAVLALECNEYEWIGSPPPHPTLALPALPRPTTPGPTDGVPPPPPPPPPMGTSRAPAPAVPVIPASPPAVTTTTTVGPPTLPAAVRPADQQPTANPQPDRPPQPGFNPTLPRR
jgi:hypothetical protein